MRIRTSIGGIADRSEIAICAMHVPAELPVFPQTAMKTLAQKQGAAPVANERALYVLDLGLSTRAWDEVGKISRSTSTQGTVESGLAKSL
jgi:hypothetical protein